MTARGTRRGAPIAAMFVGLGLLAIPAISGWQPRLIWNASASVPLGLYAAAPADSMARGDLVLVRPPEALAAFFAERGYIAHGVPLLKHIAALPPQLVCAIGDIIMVDGLSVTRRRSADRLGRPLPTWHGCRMLEPAQVFLLNVAEPDSLDGRYFGPIPRTSIVARLRPVWITGGGP